MEATPEPGTVIPGFLKYDDRLLHHWLGILTEVLLVHFLHSFRHTVNMCI